jgi:hypothetical protein
MTVVLHAAGHGATANEITGHPPSRAQERRFAAGFGGCPTLHPPPQ